MTTSKQNQARLDAQLVNFTGTQQYYRHMSKYLHTDGVQFLAETYGTFWLINEIQLANYPDEVTDFQVWKLNRVYKGAEPTNAFTLTCSNGNKRVLLKKEISFSDFSGDYVELWFSGGVLYLPSEH